MAEGGVTQSPSGPERLIVSGPFLTLSPSDMFRAWVEPGLITRWWPHEAEIDLREGGSYHFSWPSMSWHLRGEYLAVQPDSRLTFTWSWDHEDSPDRTVDIRFDPLPDGGTLLTLEQGSYTESQADQEEREGHIAGWLHFLGRLYMASPKLASEALGNDPSVVPTEGSLADGAAQAQPRAQR
jgi:uncharacterized protein YndB with AHSA1/START domain